jgi:biotin-independent malonate decarboxylase gamma subunit
MGSERAAFLGGRKEGEKLMSEFNGIRGRVWFKALTGQGSSIEGDPNSVLTADAPIGDDMARFLCVVPNPDGRFPCARRGEVGLEEAYTLAARAREAIGADKDGTKRPIVAIVNVKSQAYGRREEIAGIHQAAAAAADAYVTARLAGHPIIALIVGHAISGGFLTHGYQANRLLALDDDGVLIHAMHKEAAARVTRRTVAQLDKLAETVPPLSYNVRDYAKLGLLYKLLHVANPENPAAEEVALVRGELIAAIQDARKGSRDLRNRIDSEGARMTRKASRLVRARVEEQWNR